MDRNNIKESWRSLTNDLNFTFLENIEALLNSKKISRLMANDHQLSMDKMEQMKSFLQSPWMKKILDKLFLGMGSGKYKGFECFIYRSMDSSEDQTNAWVNIVVFHRADYDMKLLIGKSGFFSRLGGFLFPGSRVHPPDAALDSMITVKGKDKERIAMLLSHTPLRERLKELYAFSRDFKISDMGIKIKLPGDIAPKETVVGYLDIMTATAEQFF